MDPEQENILPQTEPQETPVVEEETTLTPSKEEGEDVG